MKGKMTRVWIQKISGTKIVRRPPKKCYKCGQEKLNTSLKFGSFILQTDGVLEINWASFCSDCAELIQDFVGIKQEDRK